MWMIIFLIAMISPPSADSANTTSHCQFMTDIDFSSVRSKDDIENIVSDLILSQYAKHGHINWNRLLHCFDFMGDRFISKHFPGGGFDEGDIYRFTFDRSNALTPFTSVPGASNDVFTAIVNVTADGKVGIVRRGGRIEWLKFELKETLP